MAACSAQPPRRNSLSYVSDPLERDTTVIGAGRVDLWVRAWVFSDRHQALDSAGLGE